MSEDGRVVVIWKFPATKMAEVTIALDEFDDFEAAARHVTADIITRARALHLPGIPMSVDATDDEFFATWNTTPEGEMVFGCQ